MISLSFFSFISHSTYNAMCAMLFAFFFSPLIHFLYHFKIIIIIILLHFSHCYIHKIGFVVCFAYNHHHPLAETLFLLLLWSKIYFTGDMCVRVLLIFCMKVFFGVLFCVTSFAFAFQAFQQPFLHFFFAFSIFTANVYVCVWIALFCFLVLFVASV